MPRQDENKISTGKNPKGEDETWFQIVTESGGKHRHQNTAVGRNRVQVHPFNFGVDLSEHTSHMQSYIPLETIRMRWLCQ